jgi:hypothetical protein
MYTLALATVLASFQSVVIAMITSCVVFEQTDMSGMHEPGESLMARNAWSFPYPIGYQGGG